MKRSFYSRIRRQTWINNCYCSRRRWSRQRG